MNGEPAAAPGTTEVFVTERGQLTTRSKHDLRAAGIVIAEVEDLARCEFKRASSLLSADDILWSALHALNVDGGYGKTGASQRDTFVRNLVTITTALRKGVPAK